MNNVTNAWQERRERLRAGSDPLPIALEINGDRAIAEVLVLWLTGTYDHHHQHPYQLTVQVLRRAPLEHHRLVADCGAGELDVVQRLTSGHVARSYLAPL